MPPIYKTIPPKQGRPNTAKSKGLPANLLKDCSVISYDFRCFRNLSHDFHVATAGPRRGLGLEVERFVWQLAVQVGSQSISPLFWALRIDGWIGARPVLGLNHIGFGVRKNLRTRSHSVIEVLLRVCLSMFESMSFRQEKEVKDSR